VHDGACCDECNAEYVIPARLDELRAAERKRDAAGRRQRWRLH
jgi:hypothetical protein